MQMHSMTEERTNNLTEFCRWYADFHGTRPKARSVFITCLCGHFHTYPKAAETILRELKRLRMVEESGGSVRILSPKR